MGRKKWLLSNEPAQAWLTAPEEVEASEDEAIIVGEVNERDSSPPPAQNSLSNSDSGDGSEKSAKK